MPNSQHCQTRYWKLRNAGLCTACASQKAENGGSRCYECARIHRESKRPSYMERKLRLFRFSPKVEAPEPKPEDVPRCRCGLSLPCNSCLPTIHYYATIRRGEASG